MMECRNTCVILIHVTYPSCSTKSTKQVPGKKHQEETTLQRKIQTWEIYERIQSQYSQFLLFFYRTIKQTCVKLKTHSTKY